MGLGGQGRKERFQKKQTRRIETGRSICDPHFVPFSVQTLLSLPHHTTHAHLPRLHFFSPEVVEKRKRNSRNVRHKIGLGSDDTWPVLKMVGKRILYFGNCIRVFSVK